MADKKYQAIVIGSGPGGYVAGIRLGQLGINAAVIEKEHYGGVCLNWGCIPSKALIQAGHVYHNAKDGEEMGIQVGDIDIDAVKLQAWKDKIVDKMTGGVKTLLKGNKVDMIDGEARFTGPNTVEVKRGNETMSIAFDSAIVATGATPFILPGWGIDEERIVTAKGAVNLKEIPARMLVVGGGIIGMELGCCYQNFGTEVTVVEALGDILTGVDKDLARLVKRRFKGAGGTIHVNAMAKSAERKGDVVKVTFESEGQTHEEEFDVVLLSIGFKPLSKDLGLDTAGVQLDEKGFITIDHQMRTNVSNIYAIGDVTGPPFLAHRASKQGEVAAEVIAGHPAAWDVVAMPSAIFTDPEIATVGLTEEQAKEQGVAYELGKFSFAANGRAMAMGGDGFAKVLIDPDKKIVLGVGIVGPNASDLISEVALGMEMGAVAEDIGLTVHPHPTLPEVLNEAMKASLGEAIHALNRKRR